MKVLILFRGSSGRFGGSERVLAAFVRVFKESGYFVKVVSFDGAWNEGFMGVRPDEVEGVRVGSLARFFRSERVVRRVKGLKALFYTYLFWSGSFDYVVDAAYNDLKGSPDIGYVHYPTRRSCGGFKLNYLPSYILEGIFTPRARYILANSSWTLNLIRRCGVDGYVVHPPVNLIKCESYEKENLVVGLGRLGKPWEEFIEIARAVKTRRSDIKFVIAGYADSRSRVEELRALARGSVEVIPNISEEGRRELLCRARAILHTHPAEHFGLVIVEAMSTGAVPVVHKDGGAWFDIVEEGRYGFGYDTIEEAVDAVVNAVGMGEEQREEIKQKARQYTYQNFKAKILKLINE